MRAWLISAYDQPRGHSTRMYDFATSLIARGHSVTFFTNSLCHFTGKDRIENKEKYLIEKIDEIDVIWMKTPSYNHSTFFRGVNMIFNFWRIFTISKIKNFAEPDVVIGPSVPLLTGLAAFIVARRFKAAFIFDIRDVWPEALALMNIIRRNGIIFKVFRSVEKTLYRNASLIISSLPKVTEHITASIGEKKIVEYIPNGINLELFGGICRRKKIAKTRVNIYYIGGFSNGHDLEIILKAALDFQKNGDKKFKFHLYGSGVKKSECNKFIKRYGLKNIVLNEPVPKRDIPELQCKADILIATQSKDGASKFGLNLNKLSGYMASGKPIILTSNSESDLLSASGIWYKCKAGDYLCLIKHLRSISNSSPDDLNKLGIASRRYIEKNISMEVIGDKFEMVLKKAIQSNVKNMERFNDGR